MPPFLIPPHPGFGQQSWFGQLFDYGLVPHAGQHDGDTHMQQQYAPGDVDQHVVPALVAKVVLPLVLQRVWCVCVCGVWCVWCCVGCVCIRALPPPEYTLYAHIHTTKTTHTTHIYHSANTIHIHSTYYRSRIAGLPRVYVSLGVLQWLWRTWLCLT